MFNLRGQLYAEALFHGVDDPCFKTDYFFRTCLPVWIYNDQRLQMPHTYVAVAVAFPSATVYQPRGRNLVAVADFIVRWFCRCFLGADFGEKLFAYHRIFEETSRAWNFDRIGQL